MPLKSRRLRSNRVCLFCKETNHNNDNKLAFNHSYHIEFDIHSLDVDDVVQFILKRNVLFGFECRDFRFGTSIVATFAWLLLLDGRSHFIVRRLR